MSLTVCTCRVALTPTGGKTQPGLPLSARRRSVESDGMLRTELTRLLGLQYPIVQAPMAGGPTTPDLVAEVSAAGLG